MKRQFGEGVSHTRLQVHRFAALCGSRVFDVECIGEVSNIAMDLIASARITSCSSKAAFLANFDVTSSSAYLLSVYARD